MTKTLLLLGSSLVLTGLLIGCDSGNAQPAGYAKQDFAKSPPPAGYMQSVPKGGPSNAAPAPPKKG